MTPSVRLLASVICVCAVFLPSAGAAPREKRPPVPTLILQADSVAIDCDACPRDLAKAGTTANEVLLTWKRFRIVDDRRQADLIFLFSGNPYLGDYLTRDGPDKRPVMIDRTIMTVIDPHTGQELWGDSRIWGSWRVVGATKDLIEELRGEMESQVKNWTLDDVLRCSGTPPYAAFAFSSPEESLKKVQLGVSRIADAPDRLSMSSPDVPAFCRQAQLVIGPDNKIVGFEVVVTHTESLDVNDVLQQGDQFEFTSGKDTRSQGVYFIARSKDQKIVLRFDMQGHRSVLTRVTYSY
jgi:hypothetical protein